MKAVGLLSGGLDSTLAAKHVKEQGLDVEAVTFVTPFCSCGSQAIQAAKTLNIPLKIFHEGTDYVKMVRNPKFGYGRNINPCVDCKIFMLKKAKRTLNQSEQNSFSPGKCWVNGHVSTQTRTSSN